MQTEPGGKPRTVARLVRVGRRRLKYFAECIFFVGVAIAILLWAYWSYSGLPPRSQPDEWEKVPQRVWTPAEAAALAQQLVDNKLGVPAALFGPGPVPLDRSGSNFAGGQRQRFNQLTEDLKREHTGRLRGDRFAAQSLQSLRDNFVTLRGRANPDRQGAQDIAYQLAIVDFLDGRFADARQGLTEAGCDRPLPINDAGEDANANSRSQTIRCRWLEGRLALAPDQRDAAVRQQGRDKLRIALRAAIAGSPADAAVMAGRDVAPGPEGRSRLGPIPSLLSGDYWTTLPEAAGASLWQDYLSALLMTRTALCSGLCSDWNDAALTEDGRQFAALARQPNQDMIWQTYPELAALARILLTTNGMVFEARKIAPEGGGLNLADAADDSTDGFQLARSGSRADMVTLHPDYFEFARLAMIASQSDPEDPAKDIGEPSLASKLWVQHNRARAAWLEGNGSAVENPFSPGTPEAKAYATLQASWSENRPGDRSWLWYFGFGIPLALAAFGLVNAILAAFALGPSRARHHAELFGSRYFGSVEAGLAARGGQPNA